MQIEMGGVKAPAVTNAQAMVMYAQAMVWGVGRAELTHMGHACGKRGFPAGVAKQKGVRKRVGKGGRAGRGVQLRTRDEHAQPLQLRSHMADAQGGVAEGS